MTKRKSIACLLVISLLASLLSVALFVSAEADLSAAEYKSEFVTSEGLFNTSAPGFPANYTFDISKLDSNYKKPVPMKFFHAAKASGKTVVLVDGIGVRYVYKPEYINDISPEQFDTTVQVGGQFRTGNSYSNVGKAIAAKVYSDTSDFALGVNFAFVQLISGQSAVKNVELQLNLGNNNAESANRFYSYAEQNKLYVYQYVTSGQTINASRATQKCTPATKPYVSCYKPEEGELQLLFSDRPLREEDFETEEPSSSEPTSSAPVSSEPTSSGGTSSQAPVTKAAFKDEFVSNGQFVTSAAGFPETYVFTFGSFNTSNPGFTRDLFRAIKNSGRTVTLIDRNNIEYVIDGSKLTDADIADASGLFQLQSLWKNSADYQAAAGKIGNKAKITDGFYIYEDYVILDVQPASSVGVAVNNKLPNGTVMRTKLSGGAPSADSAAVVNRFFAYAQEGKLKAYFYDKGPQDLFEDKAPLTVTADANGYVLFPVSEPCTLIFSVKDLLSRRNEEFNPNPYEMRIKKDGKNMSDGYTIELGDIQYFELSMNNGNIEDFEYIWDVIGPGAGDVTIAPVEGTNNLIYQITPVQESDPAKPFQVRVRIKGQEEYFVTTGTITITDTVYGKNFLKSGAFDTTASGFPQDLVFKMPSSKYQVSGEFLNAVAALGQDVTLIDSSNVAYILHGAEMEPVDPADWAATYPMKALYKDSDSYQRAMLATANVYGYTEYVINRDYQIIDFQAHAISMPFETDIMFRLVSKANDNGLAATYAEAFRKGELYVYVYSKTTQTVFKPFDGLSLAEDTDYFTMKLEDPITLVFSMKKLLDDVTPGDDGDDYDDETDIPGDTGDTDENDEDENPTTGASAALPVAAVLGLTAACTAVVFGRKGRRTH